MQSRILWRAHSSAAQRVVDDPGWPEDQQVAGGRPFAVSLGAQRLGLVFQQERAGEGDLARGTSPARRSTLQCCWPIGESGP